MFDYSAKYPLEIEISVKVQTSVFTVQRPLNGDRSRLHRPTQTVTSTVQRSLNGEGYLLCRIVVNHCSLSCSRYESFGYIITNRSVSSLVIVLQHRPNVAKTGRA